MKNLIPKRRFEEFKNSDPWEQRKLGDLLEYEQPTKYIVKSTDYDDKFEIPVLTAGQSFILGYTNEVDGIKEAGDENPVIIFDDFTTGSHYVNFPFKVKSSAMKLLSLKSVDEDFYFVYNTLKNINYAPQSHERHWISKFSEFDVAVPSYEEQAAIGKFFLELDHLITLHQRKLDKLKETKSAYLSEMFPKEGEFYPKRRFAGFTDPWEQRKLGEVGKATGGTSIESEFVAGGKYKVISIGSYSEDSIYTDQGIRANETKKTSNRILNKDDLTMILNDKTTSGNIIGRVLLIDADDTYVYNQRTQRIEVNKDEYIPVFLYHYLNATNIRSKVINASQGNTQIYVNWSAISELQYLMPKSLSEQKQIGTFFSKLDNLITLHQRKLDKLQALKQAYLSEMFI